MHIVLLHVNASVTKALWKLAIIINPMSEQEQQKMQHYKIIISHIRWISDLSHSRERINSSWNIIAQGRAVVSCGDLNMYFYVESLL